MPNLTDIQLAKLRQRAIPVAFRLDITLPQMVRYDIDVNSVDAGALFQLLSPEFSYTEGFEWNKTSDANAASSLADAINGSGAASTLYAEANRDQDGRLVLRARQGQTFEVDTLPDGFEEPDSFLDRTISFVSTSVSEDDGIPALASVSFGAQRGEPITRAYSHDPTEVTLLRTPQTKELIRTVNMYLQDARLFIGVALEGQTFDWARVGDYKIGNFIPKEVGVTYSVRLDPIWEVLRRTLIGGEWIHMHPLEVAKTVLNRAGRTADAALITAYADTKRSHFSVTRASDLTNEPVGLGPESADVPAVDAGITDPVPSTELLNQIALMMNGGFYEDAGQILWKGTNENATAANADLFIRDRWNNMRARDEIFVRKVTLNINQFATDSSFQRPTQINSAETARDGAEATIDLPWCNGIALLRRPMMEQSELSARRVAAQSVYLDFAQATAGEQELLYLGSLFFDDLYFTVGEPMRGFCGARIRFDSTSSTYVQDTDAALNPSLGRFAYIEIDCPTTRIEPAAGLADLTPSVVFDGFGNPSSIEITVIFTGLEPLISTGPLGPEILVVDAWEAKTVGLPRQGFVRVFPARTDDHQVISNLAQINLDELSTVGRHPYFVSPGTRSAPVQSARQIYDSTITTTDPQEQRNLTPFNLRARISETSFGNGANKGRNAFGQISDDKLVTNYPNETDGRPYCQVIDEERYYSTPGQDRNLGVAVDKTIAIYVGQDIIRRFELGQEVIEILLPLDMINVDLWDVVTLISPELDLGGVNGVGDGTDLASDLTTVTWEVTGIRIVPDAQDAGIQVELTKLSDEGVFRPATFTFPVPGDAPPNFPTTEPIVVTRPPIAFPPPLDVFGSLVKLGGTANLSLIVPSPEEGTSFTTSNTGSVNPTGVQAVRPVGNNRALYVQVVMFGGGDITAATYGGEAMSTLPAATNGGINVRSFFINEAGVAAGTNNDIVFTQGASAATNWVLNYQWWVGASIPFGQFTTTEAQQDITVLVDGATVVRNTAKASSTIPVLTGYTEVFGSPFSVGSNRVWSGTAVKSVDDSNVIQTNINFFGDPLDELSFTYTVLPA